MTAFDLGELRWWVRWWLRYFPVLAIARLSCRHEIRYDGDGPCLRCAEPWFAKES